MATQIGQKKASDFIKPHALEAVKQYIVYDGFNRMSETYVALSDSEHGTPCLKTEYVYAADSARVIKLKESIAVWDSAWDV